MKKIALLLLPALLSVSYSYSQTLRIIKPGDPNTLNDSVISYYGHAANEITSTLNIINTSATDDTVKVEASVVSVLSGATSEICWAGYCVTGVNKYSYIIGPGDTAKLGDEFNGDYFPNGQIGTTTLKYVFYDIGRRDIISDTITINYITVATGIAELSAGQISFSAPYPNPAYSSVNFNYNLANGIQRADLKIFNLLGDCVQTLPLSALQNKATIDVHSMSSGIYVCEVAADGCQPVYQKLIVSH